MNPLKTLSLNDLAQFLSPVGIEHVDAVRSGRVEPTEGAWTGRWSREIDRLRSDLGDALGGQAHCSIEDATRLRGELLAAVRSVGPQERGWIGQDMRWLDLAARDQKITGNVDLILAPIAAGQWGDEKTLANVIGWSVHGGWHDRWFNGIAALFDAPVPAAYRVAIEVYRRRGRAATSISTWPSDLKSMREAAQCATTARESVEWRPVMPGAPCLIDVLMEPATWSSDAWSSDAAIKAGLLQAVDALVDAGAMMDTTDPKSATLNRFMRNAMAGSVPVAARLVERFPDLPRQTPGFHEAHEKMRARLLRAGDIDQANAVAAIMMSNAARASAQERPAQRPAPRARVF